MRAQRCDQSCGRAQRREPPERSEASRPSERRCRGVRGAKPLGLKRKRTGPGGPPGLQNRLSPALSGRAEFDSQALPPCHSPAKQARSERPAQSSFKKLCVSDKSANTISAPAVRRSSTV